MKKSSLTLSLAASAAALLLTTASCVFKASGMNHYDNRVKHVLTVPGSDAANADDENAALAYKGFEQTANSCLEAFSNQYPFFMAVKSGQQSPYEDLCAKADAASKALKKSQLRGTKTGSANKEYREYLRNLQALDDTYTSSLASLSEAFKADANAEITSMLCFNDSTVDRMFAELNHRLAPAKGVKPHFSNIDLWANSLFETKGEVENWREGMHERELMVLTKGVALMKFVAEKNPDHAYDFEQTLDNLESYIHAYSEVSHG